MITYIDARFVGHSNDDGYQQGHIYQLQITTRRWSNEIIVVATHGYQFKPIQDMELFYPHLEAFLRDWKTLGVKDSYALS